MLRVFSFEVPPIDTTINKLLEQQQSGDSIDQESGEEVIGSDIQVTVTSTTLDTSSPSDDTTIQDTMISPDTDSANSRNISPDHNNQTKSDNERKIEGSRSSCTSSNSIVSSDSMILDTLDSRNFMIKNSESEIGRRTVFSVSVYAELSIYRIISLTFYQDT